MLKKLIIAFAIIFFASIGNQSIALVAADEIAPEIKPKDIVHYAIAMHGEPKYKSDFTHLEYANPDAIKGGVLNLSAIGGFDSLNPHILKGNAASGITMVYQTILESTKDEAFTEYGLIAENIEIPEDRSWVIFNLRPEAKWHDGVELTADDVVWSFDILREKGHPFYKAYYANVTKAEKLDKYKVKFTFNMANNRELPLIMGQMTIFPKHFWQDKDFASTSLKVIPIGSGPYKIKSIDAGRNITYERVKDWWAKDLPINKGRYNFDEISYDYYKDSTVALEAFFSNEYDFRSENIAKSWFTAYDKKPVNEGKIIKKELIHERPTGMQGFAFNTRRDMFKDKIVRKAIGMAFDFEWSNKQFAFSSYKRTNSYFSNSELASQGIPTGAELHVLEDFKGDIANEIFIKPFKNPKTDGTGRGVRKNIREASKILTKSGWLLDKEKNIRMKDGKELSFEILSRSPDFERWVNPLIKNLGMLGIKARFRVVDTAQYQNRMDSFDFDMTIATFGQSLSPGNEQRDFWHSSKADVNGSRNIIGIKNPVIDELIDLVIKAKSREDLIAATRALDRVLLSEYYVIPQWHLNSFRIAYWDKFGRPDINPKYGLPVQETWWVKEAQTESPMESK